MSENPKQNKEINPAYEEFLKSLRVALTNTSVYFKEHPLYRKAVEDFRINIEKVLPFLNPIDIGVTHNALMFGNEYLEDNPINKSLAEFLHLRKIKNIEIQEGIGFEELAVFLTFIGQPQRQIIIQGGLSNILKQAGVERITVRDLDYSQLLKSDGAEYADMWFYLLKEGLTAKNTPRIKDLADHFEKMLSRLSAKDLLSDRETAVLINNFFAYLKLTDEERFFKCASQLTKTLLMVKEVLPTHNLETVRAIYGQLSADDLSRILLMHLESKEKIDNLSFSLFAELVSQDKHQDIAGQLAEAFKTNQRLWNNPRVIIKMRELFSLPGNPYVVEVYRKNLSFILRGVELGEGFAFDYELLQKNYRLLLLDAFLLQTAPEGILFFFERAIESLRQALGDNDIKFIKDFTDAFRLKTGMFASGDPLQEKLLQKVSLFVEDALFSDQPLAQGEWFTGLVTTSTQSADYYYDKIFREQRVTPYILRVFFQLFPQETERFCQNLEREAANTVFLKKFLVSLEGIDAHVSSQMLQRLFWVSNNYLKLEILKRMQTLALFEETFLFALVHKGDFYQRKQALISLSEKASCRVRAAQMLLGLGNPFGIRTKLIEENLALVGEVPFAEAKPYLEALSRVRFFWNRMVRVRAREILKRLEG